MDSIGVFLFRSCHERIAILQKLKHREDEGNMTLPVALGARRYEMTVHIVPAPREGNAFASSATGPLID